METDCTGCVQLQGFQVNALVRKSWACQRKNISMSVCMLLAPIFVATLLGLLQMLLDDWAEVPGLMRVLASYLLLQKCLFGGVMLTHS